MNEEKIKELLNVLFSTTATQRSSIGGSNYTVKIIEPDHQMSVEQIIRGFLLDNRDSKIGELEAKVFVYEQIIAKSNFSTVINTKNTTETNNSLLDEIEKLRLQFEFYKAGEVAGMRELEVKNHKYEKALRDIVDNFETDFLIDNEVVGDPDYSHVLSFNEAKKALED